MRRFHAGFTLLELVVVIAMIGIMSTMVAPTMTGYLRRMRMDSATELLKTRLSQALSQARSSRTVRIVRGNTATNEIELIECPQLIDPLTDGITCGDCTVLAGGHDKIQDTAPGVTLGGAFDVRYYPPHGDVVLVDSTEVDTCDPVTSTLDEVRISLEHESGLREGLLVHDVTGLVERVNLGIE